MRAPQKAEVTALETMNNWLVVPVALCCVCSSARVSGLQERQATAPAPPHTACGVSVSPDFCISQIRRSLALKQKDEEIFKQRCGTASALCPGSATASCTAAQHLLDACLNSGA